MSTLEEYIETYPEIQDKKFLYELTRKKELYDLQLSRVEEPVKGELLQSQKIIQRLFSPHTTYKELMLVWGTGVGKTCGFSAIVENFKSLTYKGVPNRPALIFVQSEEHIQNIENQIAKVCFPFDYTPTTTIAENEKEISLSKAAFLLRQRKLLRESYDIVTIRSFFNKKRSKEFIRNEYSGRRIIIDESHHVRRQPKVKSKKGKKSEEETAAENEEVEAPPEFLEGTTEESESLYRSVHEFLHTVEDCVKIISTATPAWDRVNEFADQMNLILPLDMQLPTGRDFDLEYFDETGQLTPDDRLRHACRGRVSFLRQMMTTAVRTEIGVTEPWLQHIKIYPDAMSDFQAKAAQDSTQSIQVQTIKKKNAEGKTIEVERQITGGSYLRLARAAANFVFPDGSYGTTAFNKHAVKFRKVAGKAKEKKYYELDKETKDAVNNDLATLSCKFASILQKLQEGSNEDSFVYFGDFVTSSGAILFALCLQEYGYEWLRKPADIGTLKPGKRFLLLTHDTATIHSPTQITEATNLFNDPRNKYGEYVQVVIGSRKVSEGFTLKNIRQIHIVAPHWNMPSIDQALGRGFRVGSHADLPKEERYINIYRHVALKRDDEGYSIGEGYPDNAGFAFDPDDLTTDIHIYTIAENKDYKNAQIFRFMKEMSIDCPLTYERNVLPEDVKGSRECDYQNCNYKCDKFTPDKSVDNTNTSASTRVDNTNTSASTRVWRYQIPLDKIDPINYNLLYSSPEIKQLVDAIVSLFGSNIDTGEYGYFAIPLERLSTLLGDPNRQLLLQALDEIINSRMIIRNRYGFISYLKEQGDIYFLDNNITPFSSYPDVEYVRRPFATERINFSTFIDLRVTGADKPKVLEFCAHPSKKIFDSISYKSQIILLEIVYNLIQTSDDITPGQQKVIDIVQKTLESKFYTMSDGKVVHILYSDEPTELAYTAMAKALKVTGEMRIYDKGKWSYVIRSDKEKKYNTEIKQQQEAQKELGFQDNPYDMYGIVMDEKGKQGFWIVEKFAIKQKGKGRVCTTYNKNVIIDKFFRGEAPNRPIDEIPEPDSEYDNKSKKELIKTILGVGGREAYEEYKKDLEHEDINYLKRLLTLLQMGRVELCKTLTEWFRKHKLLVEK